MRLLILFLSLIISSSTLNAQHISIKDTLKAEPFIQEELHYPSDITVIGDWLFVKDLLESTGEYGIKVFDAQTGEKEYEFIRPGKGPGEYINFDIRKGPRPNQLEVTGSSTKKSDIYDVSCLKQKPEPPRSHTCILKTVPNMTSREALILNDSLVFNTGATANGVLFLSKGNKIIKELDSIPKDIQSMYDQSYAASMAMGGYLGSNKNRSRIAFFASHYDKFEIYSYNPTTQSVKLIYSHSHSFLPKFDVFASGQSYALSPSDDAMFAYKRPASGDSYMYVPYSGKTTDDIEEAEDIEWRAFTNRIKIYDWDGKEIRELRLNYEVTYITVNDEESALFGIMYNGDLEATIIKAALR